MHQKNTHYSRKLFEIDAKWTCQAHQSGWCHFRIATIKKSPSGKEFEMMSVCDRATRFWIRHSDLKKLDNWKPGWL